MAINVLGFKYPYSDTGRWAKDEVASIDPEKVIVTGKPQKAVDIQSKDVSNSNNFLTDIKSIDIEISQLMLKRQYLSSELCKTSLSAVASVFNYTIDSADKLANDFQDFGFSSNNVRKAVKNVRNILFDDTDERFQQVVCTKISFGGDDSELMFYFEHEPTGKCFRIDIPVYINEALFGLRHKSKSNIGSVFGIGIVYAWSHSVDAAIAYSYDIRVIREQLRLLAERGFEPIIGEEENIYRKYHDVENENIMTPYDYELEGYS